MKIFGLEISRAKAAPFATPVYGSGSGWWNIVRESFPGAWQRNVVVESKQNILAFSAVYACVAMIADDISKLCIELVEDRGGGIWTEVERNAPHYPVLVKPNAYQTRIQFLSQWVTTKLLYGNTYILKERDRRGVVTAMHILDSRLVVPKVTASGDIYYDLSQDSLSGVTAANTFPASEVMHDRCIALFHPLVGVSPIYACGSSATQGIRIQNNSTKFFENMSRPSGQLTAPGFIEDEVANRLKREFEENFMGDRVGRLFVGGSGLKYEAMTMPAQDAQLIEQLRWTVEDVARCFKVPLSKLMPTDQKVSTFASANQEYYSQCLQAHIEAIELLLDEGLGLVDVNGRRYGTQLDLDNLLRMDPLSRMELHKIAVSSAIETPNEARANENRAPKQGGDELYMQQQNFSLPALAKRDAQDNPFAKDGPTPSLPAPTAAPPAPAADDTAKMLGLLQSKLLLLKQDLASEHA